MIGRTDLDVFEDRELAELYIADDKKLKEGGVDLLDYLEPLPSEDGGVRFGSTSKHILYDETGKMIGLLGITKDVTREHLTRQYYRNEMSFFFDLSADVYTAILVNIDNWRIVEQRHQSIDGIEWPEDYTVEALIENALDCIVQEKGDGEASVFFKNFNQAFLEALYDSGTSNLVFEYLRRMPDDSLRWVQGNVKFLVDPEDIIRKRKCRYVFQRSDSQGAQRTPCQTGFGFRGDCGEI